ncbi:MAG: SMR family transporter [Emcibacteraceae bacterium]
MTILSNILIMLVYIITSVTGLVFLKQSDGALISTKGIAGIFFYGLGFLIWYVIVTRIALSLAFPIAAGGLVVATQIAGYFILKENLSVSHLIGVALIIAGISFVATGETHI